MAKRARKNIVEWRNNVYNVNHDGGGATTTSSFRQVKYTRRVL